MASVAAFPPERPNQPPRLRRDQRVADVPLAAGGTRRERYDPLGRLVLQEHPDGSWLRYSYGLEGELASVQHSSGERVTYNIDPWRREWGAQSGDCETVIRTTPEGYPSEIRLRIGRREWAVRYRRDGAGQVLACEYPGGVWLETASDVDDDVREMRAGLVNYCSIRPDGTRNVLAFCSGATTEEIIEGGRLRQVEIQSVAGDTFATIDLEYDSGGRVVGMDTPSGTRGYGYDECGRLLHVTGSLERRYEYDARGRLCANHTNHLRYGDGPMVETIDSPTGAVVFEHDVHGRRTKRHGPGGTTTYDYNLFGQLSRIDLPDGRTIEYIYDGFGRLVGRKTPTQTSYYVPDLDGRRLAEIDENGTIVWSYLWCGSQCIGRIAGVLGAPLESSFHRAHGGRLVAMGDANGTLTAVPWDDPFGDDTPASADCPGFASLFGDVETGLLFAGHRWLDPAVAQFLTPDSWFGSKPAVALPPQLKAVLDRLPGGTSRLLDPVTAFAWCAYDPVNHTDVNGHNWMGLIFSVFSSLLWEAQLNGLALELEVINIIVDILQLVIFREVWDTDGYWLTSVFHLAPPVASYRLMVPFGLILNGISTRDGRAWTLGNVIFSRTKDLTDIEDAAKRDLLICSNASDYLASAGEAAANRFQARNPLTALTGTVASVGTTSPAAGASISGTAITTPAGATINQVLANADFISLGIAGESTDEIRQISSISGGTLTLSAPPLPANYAGKSVNIARLDQSILKIEKDSNRIARAVQFIRGQAIHYGTQIPEGFPTEGLAITEFLRTGIKKDVSGAAFPAENVILRMSQAADLNGYASGDFIRILVAGNFVARLVENTQPPTDLLIDSSIPVASPTDTVQVVKLSASGSPAVAQKVPSDGTGTQLTDRVTAGTLTDIQKLDGVTVTDATPTVLRRIVTSLFLDCTVDPLPASLQNVATQMERLGPDVTVQATAKMQGGSGTQIQLDPGQTATFTGHPAVSVKRQSDNLEGLGVLASVAGGLLTLTEPLPPANFADTTPVTVTLLSPSASPADAGSASPADTHVAAAVTSLTDFALNDIVRVRLATDVDGGAVRKLAVAPGVVVQLDSALPASHFTNVSVQRFTPDPSTQRDNVAAPLVQQRLTIPGTNPYVAGDQLYITGSEQAWGQVDRVDGASVFLTSPVTQDMGGTVSVRAIGPSGVTTPDGKLDEARILIPSDPGADPLTRREGVENHEMRHVWQGAVWGPFLLSLPIPWLVNVGFSFTKFRNTTSKIFRYVSVGGLDSLVALMAWAIGSRKSGTTLNGTLNATDRKTVQLAGDASDDDVKKFDSGSQVEVTHNEVSDYNLIDTLDATAKSIKLRFEVGDSNNQGGDVTVSVSPFENIRRKVSQICGLNLESIWHDHIPTSWGRALSAVAQRDSWLPPFGIYPMSLLAAGGDQERLPNEQDAAYHSGDLYTDISTSDPNTIFVGQFSKLFAFIQARYGGLSSRNAVTILQVALPSGVQPADVPGALGTGPITFRENYFIQLSDKIENAVGVYFATSKPGVYTVMPPDNKLNTKSIVFKFAFDVDFADLSKVTVNDIGVAPDPTGSFFETQDITFTVTGDPTAQYALRFTPATTGNVGTISGLKYTAPVLSGGAAVTQNVEVTATYSADHPVFSGPGQSSVVKLTPEQRTNLCKQLNLNINPLTAPSIPAVTAGGTADFTMPIAPNGNAIVTSPLPAGAAVNARVTNLGGAPATLRFFAPDNVSAATNVTFDMVFGADPANRKTVTTTVIVNPP